MAILLTGNPLSNLTCDELLAQCDELVDRATRDALKHCYENLFKEAIMKYVLKQVLKEEIQQLPRDEQQDWQRAAFVQRISCLAMTQKPPNKSNAKPVAMHSTLRSPSKSQYKHSGVSTDQLLLSGYLRTEMDMPDNHTFPIEIVSVCQHFFGDCSNMIAPNQLLVFNHDENTFSSVFDKSRQNVKLQNVSKEAMQSLHHADTMRLVAPYKLAVFGDHGNTSSICVDFRQQSDAAAISVDVQTIGKLPTYGDAANQQSQQQPQFHSYPSNAYPAYPGQTPQEMVGLTGVTQFFDRARMRLLNIGGFSTQRYRDLCDTVHCMPFSWLDHAVDFKTVYKRKQVSLCDIKQSQLAIIGGEGDQRDALFAESTKQTSPYQYYVSSEKVVDWVELYDLQNDQSVAIKNLNHRRKKAGSFYNAHSENIIVFGGNQNQSGYNQYGYYGGYGSYEEPFEVQRNMELYDFHRNIWIEIEDKTSHAFAESPCVWTVGGQCIFVAGISSDHNLLHLEWIDLREATVTGVNKSRFYSMSPQPFITRPAADKEKPVMLVNVSQ